MHTLFIRFRLIVAVMFLIVFSQAAQAQDKIFNAKQTRLENGLQVIVIPNHRTPVVTQMVWYKVGAADEVQGHSGVAHFLEHLLFKGSDVIGADQIEDFEIPDTLPPGDFSKIIRKIGGQDNAFTGQDYTAYFQSIPSDKLEMVMRMEAGRMRGASFPLKEIESENKVILEERRMRTDNDPRARFGEQMSASAFINHPYGTPVIGWYHEMEQLDHDTIKGFYDRWYAPNNAILVVSGDVEPLDVFALAQDIYGQVPANDNLPDRIRSTSPPMNSETRVTLEHKAIHEPLFQVLYRVPSFREDAKASLALEVLDEIMAGGSASRLYQSLVVKQKIATSAGLSYRSNAFDDSSLWLYATPAPSDDATAQIKQVEEALYDELRLLIQDGVSDEELQDAKTRMIDAAVYARDSLSGPAMIVGSALATGSTLNDVETWPAQIETVSAQDIQNVAKLYLNPDGPQDIPPVTGVLLPGSQDISQGGQP